ncbi:hypothetical protein ACIHEI_32610 [Kitasatospora sp. NPDC051984]|uniref:hypothetical protein n=1 Tax=Kitasatospora sp. NPDC051984 TaxID=3364059 RepID=UPI0037C505FD
MVGKDRNRRSGRARIAPGASRRTSPEIADRRTDNAAPARLWDCANGAKQGRQIS